MKYYNIIKKLIHNLEKFHDNIELIVNYYINENNNIDRVELFESIMDKNFELLQDINDNVFITKNINYYNNSINSIRKNLNKINFIIHYTLIYYIIKINNNCINSIHNKFKNIFKNNNELFNSSVNSDEVRDNIRNLYRFNILDKNLNLVLFNINKDDLKFNESINKTFNLFEILCKLTIDEINNIADSINYIEYLNNSSKIVDKQNIFKRSNLNDISSDISNFNNIQENLNKFKNNIKDNKPNDFKKQKLIKFKKNINTHNKNHNNINKIKKIHKVNNTSNFNIFNIFKFIYINTLKFVLFLIISVYIKKRHLIK